MIEGRDPKELTYKHISNYINNELGINKNSLKECIDARVEQVIEKQLKKYFHEEKLSEIVISTICKMVQEERAARDEKLTGTKRRNVGYYSHRHISDMIREAVKQVISEELVVGFKTSPNKLRNLVNELETNNEDS